MRFLWGQILLGKGISEDGLCRLFCRQIPLRILLKILLLTSPYLGGFFLRINSSGADSSLGHVLLDS
jgi:hypothetical protein